MAESSDITFNYEVRPFTHMLKDGERTSRIFREEFERAGRRVGKILEAKMRQVIQSGHLTANSDLTINLKGGRNKPLIGLDAKLWRGITSKVDSVIDNLTVYVGVMRQHERANVARVVHEGSRPFTVTPKMAALFQAVAAFTSGRSTKLKSQRAYELAMEAVEPVNPFRVGTRLVIPPRPFAKIVLDASDTRDIVRKEFNAAIERALHRMEGG